MAEVNMFLNRTFMYYMRQETERLFSISCGSYLGVLMLEYFMNSSALQAFELQACGSRNRQDVLTYNVIIFCLCSMASALEHFLI